MRRRGAGTWWWHVCRAARARRQARCSPPALLPPPPLRCHLPSPPFSDVQMGVLVPGGDRTAVKRTADFFLAQFTERLEAQVGGSWWGGALCVCVWGGGQPTALGDVTETLHVPGFGTLNREAEVPAWCHLSTRAPHPPAPSAARGAQLQRRLRRLL